MDSGLKNVGTILQASNFVLLKKSLQPNSSAHNTANVTVFLRDFCVNFFLFSRDILSRSL